MASDTTPETAADRCREARLWTRNAIAEMTVAINEASSVLVSADDKVAGSYLGNVRSAMTKAQEQLMRARILFESQ